MAGSAVGPSWIAGDLRVGDILFQELAGPVRDVAQRGAGGARFAHCALLTGLAGTPRVTEALFPRVQTNALSDFLARSLDLDGSRPWWCPVCDRPYRYLIDRAVGWAEAHVGVPYDESYPLATTPSTAAN